MRGREGGHQVCFFSRSARAGGEPINKTGDEGRGDVGRKKERSLSDQFPTTAPTDRGEEGLRGRDQDGVTFGAHLGREGKEFMSC